MTNSANPDNTLEMLVQQALEAARHSYSPYSHFRVGAALQLSNGSVVTGANVENVSYGLTICAESAAVARAVAEFGPSIRIRAVAVANLNDAPSPPCGACRQILSEFTAPDAPVAFPAVEGPRTLLLGDLLPETFSLARRD